MSYPTKYRERTIEYRKEGHTLEETRATFKVSISTIRKWEKQLKEKGNLEKKPLHRSFKKIDPQKMNLPGASPQVSSLPSEFYRILRTFSHLPLRLASQV